MARRNTFLSIQTEDLSPDFVREYKGEQSKGITRDITRFNQNVTPRLEALYRAAAPKKSGRLARAITAKARRQGHAGEWEITVGAALARGRTGFNYLPVTRFGHRRLIITPKRKQHLRFRYRGKLVFAQAVKGYRPTRDWVQAPTVIAREIIDEESSRIGDSLTVHTRTRGRSIRA